METGEPHNRRYLLRCRLCSPAHAQAIVADGEGTSKKAAKQNSCQIMLEKLKGMGKSKYTPAFQSFLSSHSFFKKGFSVLPRFKEISF